MPLSKIFRKIFFITLMSAFLLQQSGFVFAIDPGPEPVSDWATLKAYVEGTTGGQYNVTMPLTAPNDGTGTLYITADGYTVSGETLTGDDSGALLINVNEGITFNLGNNIVGDILNEGTLNYFGNSLSDGSIAGNGALNFRGVNVTNENNIFQNVVSVAATTNLTNDGAHINTKNFTNNGKLNNTGNIGVMGSETSRLTNNGEINNSGDIWAYRGDNTGIINNQVEGELHVDRALTNGGILTNAGELYAYFLYNTNGGTIINTGDISAWSFISNNEGATFYQHGGTIHGAGGSTQPVMLSNGGVFEMNGGDVYFAFNNREEGTVTLNGGQFTASYVSNQGSIENNITVNTESLDNDATGTITGSGTINISDGFNAGTIVQNDINISSGVFLLGDNSDITVDELNVYSGGVLRGGGNITGTVNINDGATLTPGNDAGTLTVTGDVNFASGSTTNIEITDTPASAQLIVTGNANIDSGANLTVSNISGRYFEWEKFDIVDAGNVSGEFTYDGTITDYDASRIEVLVDYSDPTKVVLIAKRKATDYTGTTSGLSHNQREVAQAIDAVSTGFSGDITEALLQYEKLAGLEPAGVTLIDPNATFQSALTDTGGVLYANSALAPLFNAKTAHVYDRIAKRNPSAGKCPHCHDNIWMEYYNQYDKVYTNPNSPRFSNNMAGVLVGYDRSSDDTLLGVYGGFGKSDLHQRASRADIEDTTLGLYAGYTTGDWIFKGTLYGGYQNYDAKRVIKFMGRRAEASYSGVSLALDLEAAYNIPVYSWLNVKPFMGVLGSYAHQESFTEKGAGALNLHVFSKDQYNTQARLGVRLDGKLAQNKLSWYGSAAIKRFIGDDYARLHMTLDQLPGTNMDIISNELGRTYFSGQLGLNYALTDTWSLYGNLDAGINNRSTNCYGNVGVAYTW